jgi:hypothetical protein
MLANLLIRVKGPSQPSNNRFAYPACCGKRCVRSGDPQESGQTSKDPPQIELYHCILHLAVLSVRLAAGTMALARAHCDGV